MKSNYVKTPTVFQMEATECGAASLSMVFAYYGKNIALEQMRIETGVSRDGCNAANILKAARKFGLDCNGYKLEPKDLEEIKCPCIIHWNFNHFVVFEGIKKGHAYINDPAMGRRKLTLSELDESFTGIVLTFEVTDKFVKEKKSGIFFKTVSERLHGQWDTVAKLFCIGLLLVIPGLTFHVLSQIFLDDILAGGNTGWFEGFAAILIAVTLLSTALSWYRSLILQRLQTKMILISAHKFLSHLFRLPISFFDQRYAGDLAGRVENNNNITTFLAGDLAETVLNIFVAVFYLILLIIYSPLLTLIGLASAAVNIITVQLSSKTIANTIMKLKQDQGKTSGAVYAQESTLQAHSRLQARRMNMSAEF